MLARVSRLNHPLIGDVELPLLVPAFTSKGFPIGRRHGAGSRNYSYVAADLADFGRGHWNSVLISAYDLHFDHFKAPKIRPKAAIEHLRNAALVFVDSGGYELAPDYDSTEPKRPPYAATQPFGKRKYIAELRKLATQPQALPSVIANYDWGTRSRPLREQIRAARELFRLFPDSLHDFIIKPGDKGDFVEPQLMTQRDFADLRGFNIIGVVENELGVHLGEKLRRLAELRRGLNGAGITVPIHLWGGLDPLLTPLFFFAGAEVFDGVSWLRYAYLNGVAANRSSCEVLVHELGVWARHEQRHAWASMRNLLYLENLGRALRKWHASGGADFDMFDEPVRSPLKRAYSDMCEQIPALEGDP